MSDYSVHGYNMIQASMLRERRDVLAEKLLLARFATAPQRRIGDDLAGPVEEAVQTADCFLRVIRDRGPE
jgi:hypothetical protein